MATDFYVSVGERTQFTKTVGESDVYLFAGITGDFSPNHVNQVYMERSRFGTRMVHGALLVGFMSTVSSMAIAHTREAAETPVSAGYDRIRFIKPVLLGDTITVTYTIAAIDLRAAPLDGGHRGCQSARRTGGGRQAHPAVGTGRLVGRPFARQPSGYHLTRALRRPRTECA